MSRVETVRIDDLDKLEFIEFYGRAAQTPVPEAHFHPNGIEIQLLEASSIPSSSPMERLADVRLDKTYCACQRRERTVRAFVFALLPATTRTN